MARSYGYDPKPMKINGIEFEYCPYNGINVTDLSQQMRLVDLICTGKLYRVEVGTTRFEEVNIELTTMSQYEDKLFRGLSVFIKNDITQLF